MSFSRRALLKASAASAVMGSVGAPFVARAQQAEFTYKFANNLPDAHPLNTRAKEMSAAIKTETNGRVDVQIFPNNQLGADTDVLSQLRSGGVEFFTMSGLILATLVPAASINGMGFAFPDYPTVWKAMDGDLGAYVRGQIAKANLVAMEKIWDNGFRQTTFLDQAHHRARGLARVSRSACRCRHRCGPRCSRRLTRRPRRSISTKSIRRRASTNDRTKGQENPLALSISTAKTLRGAEILPLTNHMWDGYWFLANRRAWEALPADVRAIVARNINAAAVNARADTEKLNATVRQELAAKGLTFNQPDVAPFREKLRSAGFYLRMEDEIRRRGLGDSGKIRRQIVVTDSPKRRTIEGP